MFKRKKDNEEILNILKCNSEKLIQIEEKARQSEEKVRLAEEKARQSEEKVRLAEEKARQLEEKVRLAEEKICLIKKRQERQMDEERVIQEKLLNIISSYDEENIYDIIISEEYQINRLPNDKFNVTLGFNCGQDVCSKELNTYLDALKVSAIANLINYKYC